MHQIRQRKDFEQYLELSTTRDGSLNWDVEADSQIAELISRCASQVGVSPQNLSAQSFEIEIEKLFKTSPHHFEALRNVSVRRLLSRSSLLRVTNQLLNYALPYMSLITPEEKLNGNGAYCDDMFMAPPKLSSFSCRILGSNSDRPLRVAQETWLPICGARRLRMLKRLVFTFTKRQFWESIVSATTTTTPLPQDEYEVNITDCIAFLL